MERDTNAYFLMCERKWVYHTLMVVAGFFGAYTYLLRGNVFCNAQTGNVVLMGMALGAKKWGEALYYLIPISAYLMGAFVSELLPNPVKHRLPVRWDTLLIAIELQQHGEMLLLFLGGSVVGTVFCNLFVGKAIWATLIPLGVILGTFLHADFVVEKDMLERKPAGH